MVHGPIIQPKSLNQKNRSSSRWSKPSQSISQEHPDFERYGKAPPTAEEAEKIKAVREQYGHQVTPEQLAWIRRKLDPIMDEEGNSDSEFWPQRTQNTQNTKRRHSRGFKQNTSCVIPAWSAGIQIDMDVSGGVLANLDVGNPCRHDEISLLMFCGRA